MMLGVKLFIDPFDACPSRLVVACHVLVSLRVCVCVCVCVCVSECVHLKRALGGERQP